MNSYSKIRKNKIYKFILAFLILLPTVTALYGCGGISGELTKYLTGEDSYDDSDHRSIAKDQDAADYQTQDTLSDKYRDISAEDKEPAGMDEEAFPFYALLTDEKKVVYEETLSCIENGQSGFIPSYELSEEAVGTILNYIYYEQPQLFWFEPNECTVTVDLSSEKVTEINIGYNDLADDLEGNRKLVEDTADQILSDAEGLSDVEAERYFHDYICRTVTYREGTYDQNIYSAFVENKTVCAGYTRAMQYLMMKRNVPCFYCIGMLFDEEKNDWDYHSWNIIRLNGNYYNCDITWDDFYNEADKYPSYISYEHFNSPDAQYEIDGENDLGRMRSGDGNLLPSCSLDDLNYQALYGTEWEYDVIGQLGLDCPYMIDSVEAYFEFLSSESIARGIGNHTFTFLIKGIDVVEKIGNLSEDDYIDNLLDPVEDSLGNSGWSGITWKYQYNPLWPGDEYVYMEYQLDFC
ncbi:MAG: transglutaminase domain-containing protein [Lachnospiraceae bacterium]|jgi:hypothetical protein